MARSSKRKSKIRKIAPENSTAGIKFFSLLKNPVLYLNATKEILERLGLIIINRKTV
jgi:hypothetical protein